ncbi:P-selectin-like isoform X1 [Podarcis lilfordi]|uniref:p-selectin n=1 Tax=Podarcis lilfordi TaxID=74358 RepID=A0AA35P811_9SAUR|nr:P-selectin-like isoform X1 [Podarcis lilfordi]
MKQHRKEKPEGSALDMGVTSRRLWSTGTDDHMLLFTIISCGIFSSVGAWTYHYGQMPPSNWDMARRFCQQHYTDLVAIQNKEEIAYLNATIPYYRTYYWIGIRKIKNVWTWVGTGKILTKEAENWASREPNNRRSGEDCVEIYIKRPVESGKWNDERCTNKKLPLCYQASCQPSSCSQHGECVETIGNYTCQCYPGFYGPECEYVVKCKDLDAALRPLHMNCSHPLGNFSYNSSCGFSCDEGFEMNGLGTLQCLPSGSWSAEIPQCVAIQCWPLRIPVHGDLICSHRKFQYQTSCNFSCAEGFLLSGVETTRCEASGEWSSLEPICQVKQCPEIKLPRRGTMDCVNPVGDFAYNSTCDFGCEVGFQLRGPKTLHCSASGQWTSSVPVCHVVQCQLLQPPAYGNSTCFDVHGEFQYQSLCTFHCAEGFQLLGEQVTECTASGEWTAAVPACQAMQCHSLETPKQGRMTCFHPNGEFAFQSTCEFACEAGFTLAGRNSTRCLATGNWTAPLPTCQVIECPKLDVPKNGEFDCSHPHGDFAYSSSCTFSCNTGFVQVGAEQLQCTALGMWTEKPPLCEAVQCPSLQTPDNGKGNCSHPYGRFAYHSSCIFSCNSGFELVGSEELECTDQGNWSRDVPICEAVRCPGLPKPDNGHLNCTHPFGHFAYGSSCNFSCSAGFQLLGLEMLDCTAQGRWTEQLPQCQAVQCPSLQTPDNGKGNCSQPYGHFAYHSSCIFSCNSGFELVGSEELECTDQGNWSRDVPICEAIKCPHLNAPGKMKMNCSGPWDSFRYGSTCLFQCAEGYNLNGTSSIQCQANGQWSPEMPVCQENVAPYYTKALLYTGGATVSAVALVLSGSLIALAIRRFRKKGEKKRLLDHTSDLGAPGVFSNAGFSSAF